MAQIASNPARHQPVHAPRQLELAVLAPPASTAGLALGLGYRLGFDHARHGLTPPVQHLWHGSPLLRGWQAGRALFGHRGNRHQVSRHTRLWLQLRCHAWSRGRSFEEMELTPNYLQQIATEHCPILRRPLGCHEQASIDRVRDDAGYAAGNLAMISLSANRAKAKHDWRSAHQVAASVEQGPIQQIAGLGPSEWRRLATLCSFVTELPHEEAARIPLHLLPPNRLRLFNPIQALQALVTRQLGSPGWSERLARLQALLPGDGLRADFNRFVLALAPRVLEQQQQQASASDARATLRWGLEDAWRQPLVQKRWERFALQLTAEQAAALVQQAAALRLCPSLHVQRHAELRATEGWALERGGYRGISRH